MSNPTRRRDVTATAIPGHASTEFAAAKQSQFEAPDLVPVKLNKQQQSDANLLAKIAVNGGRLGYGEDPVVWPADSRANSPYPEKAVNRLFEAGMLEVGESPTREVTVTDAGEAHIHRHAGAELEWQQVVAEHHRTHAVRYVTYSRGVHPIRGMGQLTRGCEARCICGWKVRSNDGRSRATEAGKAHLTEKLAEAFDAAGIGEI